MQIESLTEPRVLKLWLLSTARNRALTMLNNLTHAQSLNPIQRYAIQLAQLTNSVGESQLVKKILWEAQECQGTNNPQRRGLRGINTPLPKTSRCSVSTDRSDRLVQINQPLDPDRSDRSGPENPKTLVSRSYLIYQVKTRSFKNFYVSFQRFSLRILSWFIYEHFLPSQIINVASLLIVWHTYTQD